jgi:DNA-binding XRE family transcriptional regulator
MRAARDVAGVDEPPGERGHAPGREAEPVTELTRREAAEDHEVLERGHLDLLQSQLPRAGRALVLGGEVDTVQKQAEAVAPRGIRTCVREPDLTYWLCTHWPTSSRMPRVSPSEQFTRNLRGLREQAGLSQEQLADRTGLHPTEISRLERAAREPRLGTMLRLAQGLGIGIESLVADIR